MSAPISEKRCQWCSFWKPQESRSFRKCCNVFYCSVGCQLWDRNTHEKICQGLKGEAVVIKTLSDYQLLEKIGKLLGVPEKTVKGMIGEAPRLSKL